MLNWGTKFLSRMKKDVGCARTLRSRLKRRKIHFANIMLRCLAQHIARNAE